jgi:hypothetical protein
MREDGWTQYERDYLRRARGSLPDAWIAQWLERSACAVKAAALRFGFTRSRRIPEDHLRFIRESAGKLAVPQIAVHLGRSESSIHQARVRMGLCGKLAPHGTELEAFIRQKHKLGWSDNEIAAAYSKLHPDCKPVDRHVIGDRRKLWRLPENTFSEHRRRRVAEKTAEQMRKAGLPALSHLRLAVWREQARRQGWPEDLSPPYIKVLNALWDLGPQTRRELVERCGFRWRGVHNSLASNDRNGCILGHLMARGMVICLGRKVYTGRQGGNVCLYMISPNIKRKKVSHENPESGEGNGRAGATAALDGGDPQRRMQRHQVGRFAGHLRQTG